MKFTLKKPSANPAQNLAQIPEAGKFKAMKADVRESEVRLQPFRFLRFGLSTKRQRKGNV
jgi:hypothetical protein